jgi:hypothetical protein
MLASFLTNKGAIMTLPEKLGLQDWDDDKKAMIEALIYATKTLEWIAYETYFGESFFVPKDIDDKIAVIESTTGKSWREIKDATEELL